MPLSFEVLSVTITSTPQTNSQRDREEEQSAPAAALGLPIAQFDILLSGLGLEEKWRRAAHRQRARNIHIHTIEPSLLVDNEDDEGEQQGGGGTDEGVRERSVRLLKHASWERVGLHTTRAPAYPDEQQPDDSSPRSPTSPGDQSTPGILSPGRVLSSPNGVLNEDDDSDGSSESDGVLEDEDEVDHFSPERQGHGGSFVFHSPTTGRERVARPKVGDGCFIEIGLSLAPDDDAPPDHERRAQQQQRQPPQPQRPRTPPRNNGRGGGTSPSSSQKNTKSGKDLSFNFEEPIQL